MMKNFKTSLICNLCFSKGIHGLKSARRQKNNIIHFLTLTKLITLATLIICLGLTLGCTRKFSSSSTTEDKDTGDKQAKAEVTGQDKVELKIWSWFSFGDLIKEFEAENKNIKIKEELFDFSKCDEEYMKALTDGTGPDILVFDSGFFGQYTAYNVLQDLLQEPFSAGKYKNDFLGWESGFSADKKELLSLTYSTSPYVTIYRADIMKENGFPSEPEEFGKFIEKPENILKIGKKLFTKNKFIFQFPTDITDVVGSSLGYFDDNLNYIRTGDLFTQSLELGREAHKNKLISNDNFWQENGKKAIQEDRLVMFTLASYTMSTLESYVPEQKGKWRVAKAPLGVAAWASDSRLSINAQSSHKEEAWKLLEYIVTHKISGNEMKNVVQGYIPAHENAAKTSKNHTFFGEQNVYPLLEDLSVKMNHYKLTPIDDKAYDIYIKGVWESLQNVNSSSSEVERIEKSVESTLAEDISALRGQ